ncbi:MAG: rhodanese-like domain-containing protein [Pseudomonadota bacterium]
MARAHGKLLSRRMVLGGVIAGSAIAATAVSVGWADLGFAETQTAAAPQSRIIEPADAHQAATDGSILLLDIRSRREWKKYGVPSSAETVTLHDPQGQYGFVKAVLAAVEGDKNRPVALICAAGVRSSRARKLLESQGFKQIYDVSEGMFGSRSGPGWKARGLPIRACEAC